MHSPWICYGFDNNWRPSVSPLTTNTTIEAHRSLERSNQRGLREKDIESLEKGSVSVVITKGGEEPLSQKELYKKKIARHNKRRRVGGGEESFEVAAKSRSCTSTFPQPWMPSRNLIKAWSNPQREGTVVKFKEDEKDR